VNFGKYFCYELPVAKFGFQSLYNLIGASNDAVASSFISPLSFHGNKQCQAAYQS
jgi:hypothetical protein